MLLRRAKQRRLCSFRQHSVAFYAAAVRSTAPCGVVGWEMAG